MYIGLHVE